MTLLDKLHGRMTGGAEEQERRRQILAALLEAFGRGGGDAATELLKQRMNELEGHFDEQLAALEEKL